MKNFAGLALLIVGTASFALAGTFQTPEIDAAAGVGALTLLSGALLVIRGRRKRQN